ncbi:PqqD family protein [Acanthopleuribacter pedis]|uniref:PqqD family protein n=1 Tax=Acanthopleuribacter pedis TaxID=442870 RepID=A0A8J7QEG6_9BACT|nr:PqqD family protein [Acanthopleuribacter pedis]MBO1318200.1 PqqD family protein [Acanthopleuribacter pedis]
MKQVRTHADVVLQRVGEEAVLLDLNSGTYYELNPMARRIIELLNECGDPKVVAATLEQEFEVLPEELDSDLKTLLHQLEANGLLQTI